MQSIQSLLYTMYINFYIYEPWHTLCPSLSQHHNFEQISTLFLINFSFQITNQPLINKVMSPNPMQRKLLYKKKEIPFCLNILKQLSNKKKKEQRYSLHLRKCFTFKPDTDVLLAKKCQKIQQVFLTSRPCDHFLQIVSRIRFRSFDWSTGSLGCVADEERNWSYLCQSVQVNSASVSFY